MDNATNGVEAPELIITNSFNCLLSRMAALDYAGILISGRKTLRNAKRQRVDPTMRLSDVIQMEYGSKDLNHGELIITGSFNGLLQCMVRLDHLVRSERANLGLVFPPVWVGGIIPTWN